MGMNTLRAGRGVQETCRCCTRRASSTFGRGSSTTFPSTPAVARPALSSVTRRTLSSALAWERSINFCRLRTLLRSPACVAVKILCRKRRTSSSTCRQSIDCQSRSSSSGPFTTTSPITADCPVVVGGAHGVQLALRFRCYFCESVTGSPGPRQHPFGFGPLPVSGQLSTTTGGRADQDVAVSCCLSAAGIGLSSRPVPLGR